MKNIESYKDWKIINENIDLDTFDIEEDDDILENTLNYDDRFFWEVYQDDQLEYNGNNELLMKLVIFCNSFKKYCSFYINSVNGWFPYNLENRLILLNQDYIYKGKFSDWLRKAK